MRIGSTIIDGVHRYGVVDDGRLRLFDAGTDVYRAIRNGETSSEAVTFDPSGAVPVPVPLTTIRDFITFEQHTAGSLRAVAGTAEVPDAWYEAPAFYFSNPHAAIGSGTDVPLPPGCEAFDFELEVAAVIGRSGYNLSVDEAAECIAGFTILNDWSARDLQTREMRVGLGPVKAKDTATTLGPALVTPDELADRRTDDGGYDLAMSVRINGTLIGEDTLANMAWTFAELIAYASRGTWVHPGDVLGSGTCANGCLAELWGWRGAQDPPPLTAGDVVEMSVDGIGTVRNAVVAGPPLHPVPAARRGRRHRAG
ncbi:fumarylacetoacetate hydrolase family protein [Gordonia sp. TBRC 11910]|uniref:Fumarylacetoacetate hydrolase family protein n=1 Tax=Gordonia asplenii TaxID=2725283 RepID=A0A848KRJ0_9ACTN|nr:fumarylacetoacetate hydrolase family protein [Gordonia asplenii]NMO00699.1 fumarylacetoacetate hydrolase family protein [Gordonia asplenii]